MKTEGETGVPRGILVLTANIQRATLLPTRN